MSAPRPQLWFREGSGDSGLNFSPQQPFHRPSVKWLVHVVVTDDWYLLPQCTTSYQKSLPVPGGKKKSHLKQLSMMVEYTGLHVKSGPSASCPLAFYWLWTKVASCSHDSSWTGLIITFRQRWICDHIKTAQYKSNILKLNLTLNCSPGSTEQTLYFIYLFIFTYEKSGGQRVPGAPWELPQQSRLRL